MDESHRKCPQTQGSMQYNFIYMKCKKRLRVSVVKRSENGWGRKGDVQGTGMSPPRSG